MMSYLVLYSILTMSVQTAVPFDSYTDCNQHLLEVVQSVDVPLVYFMETDHWETLDGTAVLYCTK